MNIPSYPSKLSNFLILILRRSSDDKTCYSKRTTIFRSSKKYSTILCNTSFPVFPKTSKSYTSQRIIGFILYEVNEVFLSFQKRVCHPIQLNYLISWLLFLIYYPFCQSFWYKFYVWQKDKNFYTMRMRFFCLFNNLWTILSN